MTVLKAAMNGEKVKWEDIMSELFSDVLYNDSADVAFLTQLLGFNGKFNLDESSEIPHSQSPEEMVKFLIKQKLNLPV